MEIGTDAITLEEQNGIPHHMLGITTPDQTVTMANFVDIALEKIEEIYNRGHIAILVGGTGLYISAIIEGYDMPKVPPNEELRKELEKRTSEDLHSELEKLNSEAAAKIHPNNKRYVIRALEIEKSEIPKSSPEKPHFDTYMLGIQWPRAELYERVNYRVDRQIERGLLDEVKKLLKKGYDENLPSMSSLGVKEIIPYIKGQSTLDECLAILKQNTRKYAKRQMTWFRRYDNVEWITPDKLDTYV